MNAPPSSMDVASGRPSIGREFHARVEEYLEAHPELGYSTASELIRELLRRWLEGQEAERPQ